MIDARGATIVKATADEFFTDVAGKTAAVSNLGGAVHPLDTATAVAQIKIGLSDPARSVRPRPGPCRSEEAAVSDPGAFPVREVAVDGTVLLARTVAYEAASTTMARLLARGCTHGHAGLDTLWGQALQIVANPPGEWGGINALLYLRGYPALMSMYVGGVAAVAANRCGALAALLVGGQWHHPDERAQWSSVSTPPAC